jgi:hypothetical protein
VKMEGSGESHNGPCYQMHYLLTYLLAYLLTYSMERSPS